MTIDEDEGRDARWFRRDTDGRYPANAKHVRVWPYAVALPLAVFVLWGAVVLYQQIFGGDPRDPLNVNTKSRDVVISQSQPAGWSRGDIVLVCPDVPVGCAGGDLGIGYVETRWTAPEATRGTTRAESAGGVCRALATHLAERSTAPALDLDTCRDAVVARVGTLVLGWSEPRGDWVIESAPSSAARGETFSVAFRPAVPTD